MTKLTYLDFDLQIERTADGYRAQVINSPAGQASLNFTLPFQPMELENFLLRLGRTRQRTRRIEAPEIEAAKAFGARLYTTVFRDSVRDALRGGLDEARRQNARLRIRLRLGDAPELANLPWEFLYNPAVNRFLGLSVNTPLVRYLDLAESIRPLLVTPPLRVLIMISSPGEVVELDVEREWTNVRQALGSLEERHMVALERLSNATLPALQQRLRQGEYHVFHFIGHGGFDKGAQDGMLVLEDESGRPNFVSGQDLGAILYDHDPLRLAVLNACEGARTGDDDPFAGVAQSLVQQGVPAVVAMQFEITDDAAIVFSREFYSSIADNYPVDAAVAEARKAIFATGNGLEWGTPVLFMRAPDGRIFDMGTAPKAPEQARKRERVAGVEDPKLAQLYTQALAAFYTERWEPAISLFEQLIAQNADYQDAASKLQEAKRQQQLAFHYAEGLRAFEGEVWGEAIDHLQVVQQLDPTYKDASARLAEVKHHKALADLYSQARLLHQAQAWQAVINIFERIRMEDPSYPDADDLLPTAQQALETEASRQKADALHTQAIRHMNAGEWAQALEQLEELRVFAPEYHDTEALIERVRKETAVVEDGQRQHAEAAPPVPISTQARQHIEEQPARGGEEQEQPGLSSADRATVGEVARQIDHGLPEANRHLASPETLQAAAPVRRSIRTPTIGFLMVPVLVAGLLVAGLIYFLNRDQEPVDTAVTEEVEVVPTDEPDLVPADEAAGHVEWVLNTELTGHTNSVSEVAFAPDGLTLASGSSDNTVRLWQVGDGAPVQELTGHSDAVTSVAFAPDGLTLASGSFDNTVRLWQVGDGALMHEITEHGGSVTSVAFAPDGLTLASGSADGIVRLWQVSDGALIHELTGHGDAVWSVAFAPDGLTLASGSTDNIVRLWQVSDGALVHELTGHGGAVWSVAFAPDGLTLASGSSDNTVRLWQVGDGALIHDLTGHSDTVETVAFAPDGLTLASGSADGTVRLWQVSDGAMVHELAGHSDAVWSVAFAPDGLTLASGSTDNTLRLWQPDN